MAPLEFDDAAARQVDRTYATPDVVAQRTQVLALLGARPGERILDVGSGPGYLLASIAEAVGPEGQVHGLDPSEPMNGIARARCAPTPWVHVDTGDAVDLPYPDATFDAAVSTQVYEYVADMPGAVAALRRALVLDTDWDSLVWNVADRGLHQRIVTAWEEHLVDPRLPRRLPRLLREGGFDVTGQHVVVMFNPQLHEDTFSANMMGLIGAFVAGRQGLTGADVETWQADLRARAADGEYLFSLNRYVFLATAR